LLELLGVPEPESEQAAARQLAGAMLLGDAIVELRRIRALLTPPK
jgi:hypothetical protein